MATSIDLDFCGSNTTKGCLSASRRHSWPEADLCFLRPCTSGIFEPLPDQEEVELRSSMTSRNSNYSTSSRSRSTRSCNLGFFRLYPWNSVWIVWFQDRKAKMCLRGCNWCTLVSKHISFFSRLNSPEGKYQLSKKLRVQKCKLVLIKHCAFVLSIIVKEWWIWHLKSVNLSFQFHLH